ncbi:MAG: hypothetical protein PVJ55_01735 [Anaerolineae bacterium]
MERQPSDGGTLVVSVMSLCCSTLFCATGVHALMNHGRSMPFGPGSGVPMVLMGLLVWIVPSLVWSAVSDDSGEDMENE